MTILILRLAGSPALHGIGRFGKAFDDIVRAFSEAHAMAREAQRRYPFMIE
jgi:hypothetical protein